MQSWQFPIRAIVCWLLLGACGGGEDSKVGETDAGKRPSGDGSRDAGSRDERDAGAITKRPMFTGDCDPTRRPIVFVHGGFGAGDNFEMQAMRFASNGYCTASLRVKDYDSIAVQFGLDAAARAQANLEEIDALIDEVRKETGFEKVDLVGHSLGTSVSTTFLSSKKRAAKVAHYVHAAGGNEGKQPVPTLSLSSVGDKVAGRIELPGAENPDVGYLDHMAILTAKAPFVAMYEFFNGAPPEHDDLVPEQDITIAGYFRNFGDNEPRTDVTVELWEVDPATGARSGDAPDATSTTTSDGAFGPLSARAGVLYEFLMPGAGEQGRDIHLYREPLERSTHLMYLKSMPKAGSLASTLLAGVVKYTDERTDLIVQHNHRGMIAGMHSLTLDGAEMLTAAVAPEPKTLIALFAADENANNVSDLTPSIRLNLIPIPFLSGIDYAALTSVAGPIAVTFEGVTINVPRWKGDSEGTVLVLFHK